jgi:hypothetical protein
MMMMMMMMMMTMKRMQIIRVRLLAKIMVMAIKVLRARAPETILIGVNSNHGLVTAQGLKPKSGRLWIPCGPKFPCHRGTLRRLSVRTHSILRKLGRTRLRKVAKARTKTKVVRVSS